MNRFKNYIVWFTAFLNLGSGVIAEVLPITRDGQALLPVVVAAGASERTKAAANRLAEYLHKMSGARFEVSSGDGGSGIGVGVRADFPGLKSGLDGHSDDPDWREAYVLRSHAKGLHVIGMTEQAAEHAVWDLLYRLGHRQFFPGERWEVIPKETTLKLEVDASERPAYCSRSIWYGFGSWDISRGPYKDWCAKNRAVSGIGLSSGHSYDGILRRNQGAFTTHPEYLALVGGARKGPKFCISNPGLRRLVIADALARMAKDPGADSLSMDPSDGGGWCECTGCARLGSVTDQALLLANEVAAALQEKYPGKLVGMYAYNYHSPPPNIQVHPQVVVSVATAFIKGGLTLEELMSGWGSKGARLGIREYYSVNTWDRDLPGAARGGNLAYLARTIPTFHAKGARFMSAESSDNWGPNGLGYYLAARILWDTRETNRLSALVEDFLSRAFGPAKEPMREFYQQLDGSRPHLVHTDQLGRMFRSLQAARSRADTAEIRGRLDDLALYAHYIRRYHEYSMAKGAARQSCFETLIRHAYRMRKTFLVHSQALFRDLAGRDKTVSIPPEAAFKVPEGTNPWKSSEPFTAAEIAGYIAEGIQGNPITDVPFQPVTFSDQLVSAALLKLPDVAAGQFGPGRGKQAFYTCLEQAPATIELQVTGGLIEHYRDRGNVRIQLIKLGGASQTGEYETFIAEDRSVPPDGHEHTVKFAVREPGIYKLMIDDGKDRTLMKPVSSIPFAIKSSLQEPMNDFYQDHWMLYFYVPKNTKVIGLFGGEHGEVRDSAGRPHFWLNGREPNYYSVAVPDGEDGKLWYVRYGKRPVRLLTVPPYFARTPAELLLPKEIVERDAGGIK